MHNNIEGWNLSPELQDILRRNGMQAQIIREGEAYHLTVQGHDSPLLTYPINDQQVKALTDWGTNYANKTAYNTFTSIVEQDFYIPRNYVHARNAFGRVDMGLHGYREGHQSPGELQRGAFGFFYKGPRQETPLPRQDVLADLRTVITPAEIRPRRTEPAIPYKELVASDVYFSNEKFKECLESHGILLDTEKKTLTIQSNAVKQDLIYDLTDEEVKKLESNSIKEVSVQQRLDIINDVIKNDFNDKITMDTINSKENVNLNSLRSYDNVNANDNEQIKTTVVADGESISKEERRANVRAKIGGALLAGVAVMRELVGGHHPCEPAVFVEHHHHEEPHPHVYFKPGVDSPQDLAARAFEAGMHAGENGVGLGR